jgi:hypothetical protein
MRIADEVPTSRRHKATRCRHCQFCQPKGVVCGVARCAEPERDGLIVMADQMACGCYRPVAAAPATIEPPRVVKHAPVVKAPETTVFWQPVVAEPGQRISAQG